MNLKHLTDETLLTDTKNLVQKEKDLLVHILHHLGEIETRKLFSDLKFSSLFEYSVKHLGYSESQAQRRISSMRLMKQIPSLEKSVESGSLTLSNMAMAQTVFRQNGIKNIESKLKLLDQLKNKSSREAEKIVAIQFPQTIREFVKPISEDRNQMQIVISDQLNEKLLKVKALHSNTFSDTAKLLEYLCDQELAKQDPPSAPQVNLRQSQSRYVAKSVKQFARQRDQGKSKNCGTNWSLQFDHIHPISMGGITSAENLRLLCRNCNQRAALEKLGFNYSSSRRLDPKTQ
jgi:hypothetical protein